MIRNWLITEHGIKESESGSLEYLAQCHYADGKSGDQEGKGVDLVINEDLPD